MLSTLPELDLRQLQETFARDGFAVVPSLFSPEEVEEMRQNFERLRLEGNAVYDDGVRDTNDPLFQYPRLVHPHRTDENARRYLLHPRVIECLRALFAEEPVAVQSMFYFKPPGARGQAMHQDNLYLLVEPGTCIGAWTALDHVDRQSGGMLLVPGTHRGNLLCQENDMGLAKESFTTGFTRVPAGMKAVDCVMNPGDTLFFGGSVIHGSGPNRTKDRFRRSFIGHYAAGSLEKISKFYLPMVRLDGTDVEVAVNTGGGVCGESWEGSLH
jgi:phytanoyl-CoA hydroxylase